MPILVTAFNPFGAHPTNPSEILVRNLAARNLAAASTLILPTEYAASARILTNAIRTLKPTAVLCLGLAEREPVLRLELFARNRSTSPAPDNAGLIRLNHPIVPGAPETLPATLPYAAISAAWTARAIPHRLSTDAGGFVCNHVFFHALHTLAQSPTPIPCGFIHLPLIADPIPTVPSTPQENCHPERSEGPASAVVSQPATINLQPATPTGLPLTLLTEALDLALTTLREP
jgi:pyroglutamyl-peptidase